MAKDKATKAAAAKPAKPAKPKASKSKGPGVDPMQVLLQHGERIGLSIAGILTLLLLILSLFWPGSGFFSGSPHEKATALKSETEYVNNQLTNPANKPGDDDLPKNAQAKLDDLVRTAVVAAEYKLHPLGGQSAVGSLGRKVPKVFGIEEATAKLARLQIQTYILDLKSNPPTVVALRGADSGGSGNSGGPAGAASGGRGKGGPSFGALGGGGKGGPPPAAMGKGGPPPGAGGKGGMGFGMPGSTGSAGDAAEAKKDRPTVHSDH